MGGYLRNKLDHKENVGISPPQDSDQFPSAFTNYDESIFP